MIAIFGAGAIGCYVGGMLASVGEAVVLIGRESTARTLTDGLAVVPIGKPERRVDPSAFEIAVDPAALAEADLVLVCVKSQDTAEAARTIAAHAGAQTLVVSLQNGLGNVETLATELGPDRVVAGVVAFNVVRPERATFQQATDGAIIVGTRARELADRMSRAGLDVETNGNMAGVQWSKLILNLNNPLNALSGIPLREQLLDADWRRISADCAAEAMAVARAKGVRLESIAGVPPAVIPTVLRLPTPLFRVISAALLRIDPEARTSMAQDLAAGKTSEVPWLNGAVCRLGREAGVPTPVNDAIVGLTDQAFETGTSPKLSGREARRLVEAG